MTSERIVKPVRAWAEYDEWSCYIEDDFDGERGKPFWIWWYPKTGDGAADDGGVQGIVDGLGYSDQMVGSGPLRSLRVLYENGYELKLIPVPRSPWVDALDRRRQSCRRKFL
jgi:hypothetical protein